jgi:hypothetical protein
MNKVFLMEFSKEDEPESLTFDLEISLHALTGISSAKTMQLMVTIAGTKLCALVDSGSTHTFIHDVVVHRLGLSIMHQLSLSVQVMNGEHLQSSGACKSIDLSIQGEMICMDCYALPLDGFDVIFSVRWVQSLGPIVWDFAALSMAFIRDGHVVRFEGCGATLYSLEPTDNLMDMLLHGYADIFDELKGPPRLITMITGFIYFLGLH